MPQPKVIISIPLPKNGSPTITVQGVKGPACKKITESLLKKLGKVKSDVNTDEYRQSESHTDARQSLRG